MKKCFSLDELENPENVEEVISRWDKLGFLLGSTNKRNVALSCELVAYRLLTAEKGTYNPRLDVLMFPVAVRIARCFPDNVPVSYLHNVMVDALDDFPMEELLRVEKQDDSVWLGDIEAIMVSKYSDECIEELGLNNLDECPRCGEEKEINGVSGYCDDCRPKNR